MLKPTLLLACLCVVQTCLALDLPAGNIRYEIKAAGLDVNHTPEFAAHIDSARRELDAAKQSLGNTYAGFWLSYNDQHDKVFINLAVTKVSAASKALATPPLTNLILVPYSLNDMEKAAQVVGRVQEDRHQQRLCDRIRHSQQPPRGAHPSHALFCTAQGTQRARHSAAAGSLAAPGTTEHGDLLSGRNRPGHRPTHTFEGCRAPQPMKSQRQLGCAGQDKPGPIRGRLGPPLNQIYQAVSPIDARFTGGRLYILQSPHEDQP